MVALATQPNKSPIEISHKNYPLQSADKIEHSVSFHRKRPAIGHYNTCRHSARRQPTGGRHLLGFNPANQQRLGRGFSTARAARRPAAAPQSRSVK